MTTHTHTHERENVFSYLLMANIFRDSILGLFSVLYNCIIFWSLAMTAFGSRKEQDHCLSLSSKKQTLFWPGEGT